MKVIPSIDLLGGKVVRLFQGDYDKVTVYFDDPLLALDMIVSKGARHIHIVDLDGARKMPRNSKDQNDQNDEVRSTNFEMIKQMVERFGAVLDFQVGGGIRSIKDVERLLDIGVDKIVIGSLIFTDYVMYQEIIKHYGEKVVLALDVKEGKIKRNGWLIDTNFTIDELIASDKIGKVYALMSTDITVDGALTGPNLEMMRKLQRTHYRWIASGGVTSRKDLEALSQLGIYGAILGKSIFEGLIDQLSDM
ncbi:1-(5-phosphoribosyl)-5-[(5-phosphoribosylamino)methylideneamino]imidazole-4-carboxamide isomerase [Fusibacter bizertensis]